MKYGLFFLVICCSYQSVAGSVDTVTIYSNSMHKNIKAVVIKPDSYGINKNSFPAVYLLHGYDGWYSNFILRIPQLVQYADQYQTLIICPDGAKSSWYFDSPIDSSYRYETHITAEVVQYVDNNYRTVADKKHRAVGGISMGGHGALFLGLRHPDVFGAAGSISGGVDLNQSRGRFDISKRIGDTILHAQAWQDYSVLHLIEKYTETGLRMIIDCGDQDIFIDGNRNLHQKMLLLKIPHMYIEESGRHSWDYWRNQIPYQLLFFQRFFSSQK